MFFLCRTAFRRGGLLAAAWQNEDGQQEYDRRGGDRDGLVAFDCGNSFCQGR